MSRVADPLREYIEGAHGTVRLDADYVRGLADEIDRDHERRMKQCKHETKKGETAMKEDSQAKLLQAYRAAIAAGQDGIADMLEDVILGELEEAKLYPIVIGESRTTTGPPWKISCEPDVVTLGGTMECTGIDHLSEEVTV